MEVKRKRKLYTLFISYLAVFILQTAVIAALMYLLFSAAINMGAIHPAYYAQNQLEQSVGEVEKTPRVEEALLPPDCTYGVYSADGSYLYGTFPQKEQEQAWAYMEAGSYQVSLRTFYRYIDREDGEVCIVRYSILAQFADDTLRENLPNAEHLMLGICGILFLVLTIWSARLFGKYITKRLETLELVTKRIQEENLEFTREYSDIQEIDDVLGSLFHMKEALQASLHRQWEAESQKREQLAALAHDIKTPLTVIRGNAELIGEAEDGQEAKSHNQYVLKSVQEIEAYLSVLQEMLGTGELADGEKNLINCDEFADKIISHAKGLGESQKRKIIARKGPLSGTIYVEEEKLYRAVMNVLANAVEYTPENGTVIIEAGIQESGMLHIIISDSGPGFSKEDLLHATEQFYRSDKSRHSDNHYGMGLYIARTFIEQQGGVLRLENSKETGGARISIIIKNL